MSELSDHRGMTAHQQDAVDQLTTLADGHPTLTVLSEPQLGGEGQCWVRVALDTRALPRSRRARPVLANEEFLVVVGPRPVGPPTVVVDHTRFLGAAHVLSGHQLCLYLDPQREWEPGDGMRGLIVRLEDWVAKTAAHAFDTKTALFHAVGGTPHTEPGTPTVVVRDLEQRTMKPQHAYLHCRSPDRFDLVRTPHDDTDLHVPVVTLRRDLPIGAGKDVIGELLQRIQDTQGLLPTNPHRLWRHGAPGLVRRPRPAGDSPADRYRHCTGAQVAAPLTTPPAGIGEPDEPATRLMKALLTSVGRNAPGAPQYVVVAVPHPAGGAHHLLCLRVPAATADLLRDALADSDVTIDPITLVNQSPAIPMQWCKVSDERGAVTTPRDTGRPVTTLRGRVVHVWGVGGLGSWIAEFVVRAGAARVVVHDHGSVTGGLLVRQNYTESDIGRDKAPALADRLRSLRDDVIVDVLDITGPGWVEDVAGADLIIDATISRTITRALDHLSQIDGRRVTLAQVATDARTGTLGIAVVAAPGHPMSLTEIDTWAHEQARADGGLEDYLTFWDEPLTDDEFVPTRGCSIPTFHGSAADLAGIASCLLNFVCLHLDGASSGVELLALPHSMVTHPRKLLAPPAAELANAQVA